MINKIFIFFLLINILGWISANILIFLGILSSEDFGFIAQMSVILLVLGGIYYYRTPVGWFGSQLGKNHEANQIISRLFAILVLFAALLFNGYPWAKLFNI